MSNTTAQELLNAATELNKLTKDKYMSGYCTGYPHAGKLWGVAAILTGKCVKQINRHN